eukprot:scaffold167163_cov17-Tisochrysis_lutea.AAC.1
MQRKLSSVARSPPPLYGVGYCTEGTNLCASHSHPDNPDTMVNHVTITSCNALPVAHWVTMGFDLQPGCMTAWPAGPCQPHKNMSMASEINGQSHQFASARNERYPQNWPTTRVFDTDTSSPELQCKAGRKKDPHVGRWGGRDGLYFTTPPHSCPKR